MLPSSAGQSVLLNPTLAQNRFRYTKPSSKTLSKLAHNYYVYITTNIHKQVLYTGVTNNLAVRLYYHQQNARTDKSSFAGKYNCTYLIFYERFQYIQHAITREKEIKGWRREKKIALINNFNPEWKFLNDEV